VDRGLLYSILEFRPDAGACDCAKLAPREGCWRYETRTPAGRRLSDAAIAIGSALLLAVAVFGFSTLIVKQYAAATVYGTPCAMGALAGFLFGDPMGTIKLSACLFIFAAGVFLMFAYDGAVCILMAFPIAFRRTGFRNWA